MAVGEGGSTSEIPGGNKPAETAMGKLLKVAQKQDATQKAIETGFKHVNPEGMTTLQAVEKGAVPGTEVTARGERIALNKPKEEKRGILQRTIKFFGSYFNQGDRSQ